MSVAFFASSAAALTCVHLVGEHRHGAGGGLRRAVRLVLRVAEQQQPAVDSVEALAEIDARRVRQRQDLAAGHAHRAGEHVGGVVGRGLLRLEVGDGVLVGVDGRLGVLHAGRLARRHGLETEEAGEEALVTTAAVEGLLRGGHRVAELADRGRRGVDPLGVAHVPQGPVDLVDLVLGVGACVDDLVEVLRRRGASATGRDGGPQLRADRLRQAAIAAFGRGRLVAGRLISPPARSSDRRSRSSARGVRDAAAAWRTAPAAVPAPRGTPGTRRPSTAPSDLAARDSPRGHRADSDLHRAGQVGEDVETPPTPSTSPPSICVRPRSGPCKPWPMEISSVSNEPPSRSRSPARLSVSAAACFCAYPASLTLLVQSLMPDAPSR
jgi:hypothetical protein